MLFSDSRFLLFREVTQEKQKLKHCPQFPFIQIQVLSKTLIQSDYEIDAICIYNSLGVACTNFVGIDLSDVQLFQLDLNQLAARVYFVKIKHVAGDV